MGKPKFKTATVFICLLLTVLFSTMPANTKETYLQKAQRTGEGRYYNPWQGPFNKSFADLFRWQFSSNPFREEKKRPVSFKVASPDFAALEKTGRDYIVWLGHSTVFMKAGGRRVLTDPVFGNLNFLVKRKTQLPIRPEELPGVDLVLISHGHYDHLDTESVKLLKTLFDPVFITGPGYGDYFASLGITKHVELDWTEAHSSGGLKITSLPAQHWSKRGFNDTNRMLWASYLLEAGGRKYYWVGDSGYYGGFREIGERFGPIDVFMAPAGSYEPRWFMKDHHMNPEEALKAAADVRAKVFIPIHWGTFDLTDEPLWLPIDTLRKNHNGDEHRVRLHILDHGASLIPE